MSLSFQLYALDPDELAAVLADPDGVADYFMERYLTDVPGQAAWLDKSGMGILEALGIMSGDEPTGPAAWVFGMEMFPAEQFPAPYVPAESVPVIAEYLAGISDEQSAARAATNEMDPDVDYLTPYFGVLREFYGAAAARGAAVVVSPPD